MNFDHAILAEPLAFHGPSLAPWLSRCERLSLHIANNPRGNMGLSEFLADFVNQRRPMQVIDGIAEIHVNDALGKNTTAVDRALGMTDYSHVTDEIAQAAADPSVAAILLDINSPGGSAVGAPEAAAAVEAAAAQKPVVAHIETIGASAAYYLTSAASAVVASQSAIVGSIGTIASFLDFAGLMERVGITPHIFTPAQSTLKATGTPFRAPTMAEANFLQARIETLNSAFTDWVSFHRPKATPDTMRGQIFTGTEAVENGLADQVGSRADAINAALALAAL